MSRGPNIPAFSGALVHDGAPGVDVRITVVPEIGGLGGASGLGSLDVSGSLAGVPTPEAAPLGRQVGGPEMARIDGSIYRKLVEGGPDAIIVIQREIVSYANEAAARLVGVTSPRDIEGEPASHLFDADFVIAAQSALAGSPDPTRAAQRLERQLQRRSGEPIDVEVSVVVSTIGDVPGLHLVLRDNTQKKRESILERDRRKVYEMVARNEPLATTLSELAALAERQVPGALCAIYVEQEGGLHLWASPSLGGDLTAQINRLDIAPRGSCIGESSFKGEPVVLTDLDEDPVLGQHAELFSIHNVRACWTQPMSSGQGARLGVVSLLVPRREHPSDAHRHVLSLVSNLGTIAIDHRLLIEQLAHQARHDVLTGLPNRTMFEDRLQQALAQARRNNTMVGVLFVNLDRFNSVNESLGHSMGDALLQKIALRLRNRIRSGDTLARMGSDEFTLVAAELKRAEDAVYMARKIQEALREPFDVAGHEIFVTASIGISVFPQDGDDAGSLHRAANSASHEAKLSGANSFRCFTPEMNTSALRRMRVETELRRAIERQELALLYQPQFDLMSGRMVGCEALVRWQHPELGVLSPSEFIPIAEETGLIAVLGDWVLEEAVRQMKAWRAEGRPLVPLSVNVSTLQFQRPDFNAKVAAIVDQPGVAPHLLELEITESTLMHSIEESGHRLMRLRDLGIRVSVDDFGTGYSSLAYLQQLPIDSLKIDRSFVRQIRDPEAHSRPARALVQTIVNLGQNLGVLVIAEGIETQVQVNFLRSTGCHRGQGFFFSRPISAAEMSVKLDTVIECVGAAPGSTLSK